MRQAFDAKWQESDHPRAENGQFGEGSGGGAPDLSAQMAALLGGTTAKPAAKAAAPAPAPEADIMAKLAAMLGEASSGPEPKEELPKAVFYKPGKVNLGGNAPEDTDWDQERYTLEIDGKPYEYSVGYYADGDTIHAYVDDIEVDVSENDKEDIQLAEKALTKTQYYKLKKIIAEHEKGGLAERAEEETASSEWDAMSDEEQEAEAEKHESERDKEEAENTRMVNSTVDKTLASGWVPKVGKGSTWFLTAPPEIRALASPRSYQKMKARLEAQGFQLELPKTAQDSIALDKASVRRVDQDGHLHVDLTPISKANVCPYLGREIPDHEALGLDPDRVYQLYRDPEELAKAAPTFAGKPLLLDHTPASASDHPTDDTVGTVGSEPEFQAPYLMAPLTVWRGDAIDLINSGKKKQLSSAYRYRADMTSGSIDGTSYDGVMRDIVGNHVALVEEGRAGNDVIVGDSLETMKMKTELLTRKAATAHGALLAFVVPKLAKDAKVDFAPVLAGVTASNFKARKPEIVAEVTRRTSGKLAADASLEGLMKLLDCLDGPVGADADPDDKDKMKPAKDEDMDDEAMDGEGLSDEEEEKYQMLAKRRKPAGASDEPLDDTMKAKDAEPDDKDKVTKPAMDAAIAAAVKIATEAATRKQQEIRDAERAVRPYVGDLAMAHDSAEGVYRTALGAMGLADKIRGVHSSALKAILELQPLPGAKAARVSQFAEDSASARGFAERYPEASRIRSL